MLADAAYDSTDGIHTNGLAAGISHTTAAAAARASPARPGKTPNVNPPRPSKNSPPWLNRECRYPPKTNARATAKAAITIILIESSCHRVTAAAKAAGTVIPGYSSTAKWRATCLASRTTARSRMTSSALATASVVTFFMPRHIWAKSSGSPSHDTTLSA